MWKMILFLALVSLPLAGQAQPAVPEMQHERNGSDDFYAGFSVLPVLDGAGDTFAAGATVALAGRAAGDVHAAGFDLSVEAPVAGDVYAAGARVALHAPVAGDLTAAAGNLRVAGAAEVGGNARVSGGVVVLDAPIRGALTAHAGDITLNAPISGDVLLRAQEVSFGPGARIDGQLRIATAETVEVPARVIPADRVRREQLDLPSAISEAWEEGPAESPVMRGAGLAALAGTGLLLVVLAALLLGLAPERTERWRRAAARHPGRALLAGLGGMSALVGLVPVLAVTLLGLPLVPVAIVAVLAGWTLSYLLGLHVVSMRLLQAFGGPGQPGTALRLGGLVAGIVVALGLSLALPLLGWLVSLVLVLLGAGGVVLALLAPAPTEPAG